MSLKAFIGHAGLLAIMSVFATAAAEEAHLDVELGIPQVFSWVPAVYPPAAVARKLGGNVQVRFVIDETGAVTKARAIRSTDKVFEDAAVQSLLQWRFEPAIEDGRKVVKCMDIVLPFELADLKLKERPAFPPARVVRSLSYSPFTRAAKMAGDDPEYPDSLLSRHLPGEVDVEFVVNEGGRVQGLKILWATHADFIRPAVDAVEKWSFRPARQGDLTVPAPLQSALEFQVMEPKRVDIPAANGITLPDKSAGDFDTAPRLKIIVDPVYPYDLLLAGTEGEAVVEFVIGANGGVASVTVREATQPEFGRALAAALECWRFEPAFKGSERVPVKAAKRERFSPAQAAADGRPVARVVGRLRNNDTAEMSAWGLDAQLHPRHQISPLYPLQLWEEKPTGRAEIQFVIDREGRGRFARIVSATREEFGWAAATAVERWIFDPPRRGGQPVDVQVRIPFDFSPSK
jgi:TonB family protein